VPLVGAALLCLALLGFRDRPSAARADIDWPGALFLAGVLASITLLLGDLRGQTEPVVLAAEATALVAFVALFVYRQASSVLPLAEWRLFRRPSYAGATSYILLSNLVMYTTLLCVPFFIKEVQGGSVGTAGLLVGTLSVLMSALAPVSGRLSDARGRRLPAMAGGLCQLVAAGMLLSGIAANVSTAYLAAALAVLGIGSGLGTGAASTAAIEAAPRELAGAASGTMSMMRYFGSIVGAGVLGGILNAGDAAPGVGVFRALFALLAVMAGLALLASTLIHTFVRETPVVRPVAEPARE
jgi:DHA2 family methylenomycin A resistance protein-like MFS transporter